MNRLDEEDDVTTRLKALSNSLLDAEIVNLKKSIIKATKHKKFLEYSLRVSEGLAKERRVYDNSENVHKIFHYRLKSFPLHNDGSGFNKHCYKGHLEIGKVYRVGAVVGGFRPRTDEWALLDYWAEGSIGLITLPKSCFSLTEEPKKNPLNLWGKLFK